MIVSTKFHIFTGEHELGIFWSESTISTMMFVNTVHFKKTLDAVYPLFYLNELYFFE